VSDAARTALYRFYDADDCLLYVGITDNPRARFKKHAAEKSWWGKVSTREIEWLSSRHEAEVAELTAIYRERPLHNVQGNFTREIGRRSRSMYLHPMARQHFMDRPFTRHDLAEQLQVSHGVLSNYIPGLVAKGGFREVGKESGTRRTLYVAVEVSDAADASPGKGPLLPLTPDEMAKAVSTRKACPSTFGAALRRHRADRGMSLADVAHLVGFHRGFIHRVETGERSPNQRLAETADIALRANGALVEAFAADEVARQEEADADLREAIAALKATWHTQTAEFAADRLQRAPYLYVEDGGGGADGYQRRSEAQQFARNLMAFAQSVLALSEQLPE